MIFQSRNISGHVNRRRHEAATHFSENLTSIRASGLDLQTLICQFLRGCDSHHRSTSFTSLFVLYPLIFLGSTTPLTLNCKLLTLNTHTHSSDVIVCSLSM